MITPSNFLRVANDVNGNPRYVCHYFYLASPVDSDATDRYAVALTRARAFGGKKFHNKQVGGGIAFVSYNLPDLCERINKLNGWF